MIDARCRCRQFGSYFPNSAAILNTHVFETCTSSAHSPSPVAARAGFDFPAIWTIWQRARGESWKSLEVADTLILISAFALFSLTLASNWEKAWPCSERLLRLEVHQVGKTMSCTTSLVHHSQLNTAPRLFLVVLVLGRP